MTTFAIRYLHTVMLNKRDKINLIRNKCNYYSDKINNLFLLPEDSKTIHKIYLLRQITTTKRIDIVQ